MIYSTGMSCNFYDWFKIYYYATFQSFYILIDNFFVFMQMQPKIKESEYFKAKVSNWSSLEAVEDIKDRLSEVQKNIFRHSCFGHFLDVKELKFSAQLLHSILLREVK